MAGILIDTKTTDTSGQVNFTSLPAGDYYYLMKTPPPGYTLDGTPQSFTVTNATPVTRTVDANPTITATLTVIKHAAGLPLLRLAGGTFNLKKGTTVMVAESAPSAPFTGAVTFPNLMTMANPDEVSYTVQEVTQPVGYELNPNPYTVALDTTGSQQLVPNTATITGSAVVTVEDTFYNAVKLEDAEYELYYGTP